jgi:hypothetical protein
MKIAGLQPSIGFNFIVIKKVSFQMAMTSAFFFENTHVSIIKNPAGKYIYAETEQHFFSSG